MAPIQAIRIVFGTPATEAAVSHMKRWLNSHCRDWRRSDAGSEVAVDLILKEPMEAKSFRPLLAMHAKNWGFARKRYARSNYTLMTVEDCLKGPEGEIAKAMTAKFEQEKAEGRAQERAKELEPGLQRLVALLEKHTKPVLRESVKRLWNNAMAKLNKESWDKNPGRGFLDHVPPKKRRLAKATFEEKDRLRPENGLPIDVGL
jgi:hypothetical protein